MTQQAIRRHRRRRRAQRPGLRGLSCEGRTQGPGPRAAAPGRRRDDDRGDPPRLQVHLLLLRGLAPAAVDHPRPGPAAPWLRDPAAGGDRHPVPGRAVPGARFRSGADAPLHRPVLAARRGGLQALRAGDGRARPPGQADDRSAGPRSAVARSAGAAADRASRQADPRPGRRLALRQRQDDDDERGGLPLGVVRVRAAHRADGDLRHHRNLPRRPLARHRLRPPPSLHGRDRRLVPRLGAAEGGHRRHRGRHRQLGARAGRRDPDRGAGRPPADGEGNRRGRRARRTATRSAPRP